jgi:hypothetical protein
MAPADGVADRALSQRQIEGAADQEREPVFELPADGGKRQVPHACRCQFDRQRKPVQLAADLRDDRGSPRIEVQIRPRRLCPLPKQLPGRGQPEWGHREVVLAA